MGKVKLGDYVEIISGYAFNSKLFNENMGMPIIRIRDVKRGYTETYTTQEYGEKYIVKKDDLLIGMDGKFNIEKWKSKNALLNQRVCKIIPKNIDKDYVYYLLPQKLKEIENKTSYVTVKHISVKQIEDIEFNLIEYKQQKNVANKLNKIQEIIDIRKEQMDELDELVRSQFVEMFGDNEKCDLCDIAEITMGQSSSSDTYNDEGTGILFFQGKADFQEVYVKTKHYCTKPTKLAKEGDVLISVRAPVGDVNITLTECCIGRGLASIRPKKNYSTTWFLFYALKSIQKEIENKGTGSTFKAINKEILYNLQMPIVEIDRQNEFVKFAEQMDKQKFKLQKSLKEIQKLQESLIDRYFGG